MTSSSPANRAAPSNGTEDGGLGNGKSPEKAVIGEALLHPLSLTCAVLWALNDRIWKWQYGNWLTGKLSDVCSLVVFPLFLLCLFELALWLGGGRRALRPKEFVVILALVGICFALMKLFTWGDFAYSWLVALTHEPVAAFEQPLRTVHRVQHTQDPTDVITLPLLGVAWWLGKRR